jgi:membrane-anchored protein YejM (alkaline phosphatase superfamily)
MELMEYTHTTDPTTNLIPVIYLTVTSLACFIVNVTKIQVKIHFPLGLFVPDIHVKDEI